MKVILDGRVRVGLVVSLILLSYLPFGFQSVQATATPGGMPSRQSDYGVVSVYASQTFMGTLKIKITSDRSAPYFVDRILILMNRQAGSDILLDSVSPDGVNTIQVSGYSGPSKVTVIPAGSTIGEVVSAFPSNLDFLIVKDPLGNNAIWANGGAGSGLVVGLRFMSGAYDVGETLSITALVTAPSNATITITTTT